MRSSVDLPQPERADHGRGLPVRIVDSDVFQRMGRAIIEIQVLDGDPAALRRKQGVSASGSAVSCIGGLAISMDASIGGFVTVR